MKVLAAVVLVIGSVSSLGSGPYLPSGWRPEGPAFELPVRPPVVIPRLDAILQESEASGSDFLREYGPPKVQSLPEVATEQPFVFLTARFTEEKNEADAEVVEATEAIIDLKYEVVGETSSATESEAEVVTEVIQKQVEQVTGEGKSSNLEVEASVAQDIETTQEVVEGTQETVVEQENSVEVKSVSEEVQSELVQKVKAVDVEVKTIEEEVKTVEEGVKNIAEAIVSLEKEIVGQEVQFSQELSQVKSVEQTSGLERFPEGFLEYGPPGFREYGPPNQNIIPRTADEEKTEDEKIDSNETRRRRFSPKFKTNKVKKH